MTSFKRFESKPVVKQILFYDRFNLWRHRQFIAIFYQFLHIRIEIIHGSHMYILFLPRVGLYVSFLPLANARVKTSWHKGLPVVKTIYTYGFHELFLKQHIKNKLVERAKVGHGSLWVACVVTWLVLLVIGRLYRETDTVLKKLLILIKYW
jgi:hypothetical protein